MIQFPFLRESLLLFSGEGAGMRRLRPEIQRWLLELRVAEGEKMAPRKVVTAGLERKVWMSCRHCGQHQLVEYGKLGKKNPGSTLGFWIE